MTYRGTYLMLSSMFVIVSCTGENPDFDPTAGHKRIFITVNRYQGGDPSSSERPGQLICDQSASRAGLLGRWIPWLSYFIVSPVNAVDEVQDVGPWYDLNGTLIFVNKASLTQTPAAPLRITELQTQLEVDAPIWTGTRQDGTHSDNLCFSQLPYRVWYSESSERTGDIGLVGNTNGYWTQAGKLACDQAAHIICIEQ